MIGKHTLSRGSAAALALLALAAPAALARPGGPVYWSYEYEAPVPHPHPGAAVSSSDGTDAPEIGGAIVGGLVLAAGAAVATKRRVRTA